MLLYAMYAGRWYGNATNVERWVNLKMQFSSPIHFFLTDSSGAVLLFSVCGLEREFIWFYMKIAFSLPPSNIKIFYNF